MTSQRNMTPLTLDSYTCPRFPDGFHKMEAWLIDKYHDHRFCYGDGQFLSSLNGASKSPFHEIMNEFSRRLTSKDGEPVSCNWATIKEDLGEVGKGLYSTVVDPIIPTLQRGIRVFPYAWLTSCIMIFDGRKVGPIVRRYSVSMRNLRQDPRYQELDVYSLPEQIKSLIGDLAECTSGFAVRPGFMDEDVLDLADIGSMKVELMDESQTIREFVSKATGEKYIVILDAFSLKTLELDMGTEFRRLFLVDYLFGSPIYSLAGFPVSNDDKDLLEYIKAHIRCVDGVIRNKLGSGLPVGLAAKYHEFGIDIISPDRLSEIIEQGIPVRISASYCNGDPSGRRMRRMLERRPKMITSQQAGLCKEEFSGYVDQIIGTRAIVKLVQNRKEFLREINLSRLSSKGADYEGAPIKIIVGEDDAEDIHIRIELDAEKEEKLRRKLSDPRILERDRIISESRRTEEP